MVIKTCWKNKVHEFNNSACHKEFGNKYETEQNKIIDFALNSRQLKTTASRLLSLQMLKLFYMGKIYVGDLL